MNDIMTVLSSEKVIAMDSREIAQLTKKEHRNVCRDIREQLGKLPGGVLSLEHTLKNQQNGQTYVYYLLPYRETMILVSGYSVELRAKIVDRWIELEKKEKEKIALPPIPRGPQLLALAVLEAEKTIREWAPKVEVYDQIADSTGKISVQEFAKKIDEGPNTLFKLLCDLKILYMTNGVYVPMQDYCNAGYFKVVEEPYKDAKGRSRTYSRVFITPRGELWLARKLGSERASA